MVATIFSSLIHSPINNDKDKMKNMPQIKASLDKNKSQRITDFSLK